jgi:hypothetical protein
MRGSAFEKSPVQVRFLVSGHYESSIERGSTSPRIRIERKLDIRIITCRDPLVRSDTARLDKLFAARITERPSFEDPFRVLALIDSRVRTDRHFWPSSRSEFSPANVHSVSASFLVDLAE